MKSEKLKKLVIDTEKDIYELNGRSIGGTVHDLNLVFENGEWSLEIEETKNYTTSDHPGLD